MTTATTQKATAIADERTSPPKSPPVTESSARCLLSPIGTREQHQEKVHHERNSKADEPGVIVEVAPNRWEFLLPRVGNGCKKPGNARCDAEHQRDQRHQIEAARIPIGPVLLVETGQIKPRATDDEVVGDQ